MARTWSRAILLAAVFSLFCGCLYHRRERDYDYMARGQMPEYNQCPCPCPCPQAMPCGCGTGAPMGMASTAEPCAAVPGGMPMNPPATIIQPAPFPPANIPPGQAQPMPAQPSKNTRVIQPAVKTDGN